MEWTRFLNAPCGRIAAGATAWIIAAAGVLAILGPGPYVVSFIPVAVLLGVVGFIFAAGLAIEEFWRQALMMVLGLPFVGGPCFGMLVASPHFGTGVGIALLILASGAAARAVLGRRLLGEAAHGWVPSH